MGWPTPQDYNEAIQNPGACLSDTQLRGGEASTDRLGLPRPVSGAFASVYQFHCDRTQWAVRCFLHAILDQQERYAALSDFINHDDLACTVPFSFLPEGIRVRGAWFPIVKMEWVDGTNLNAFIDGNLASSSRIAGLAERFKSMCMDLDRAGIAHGDLQHGNIMVQEDGALRLVDYDGMFVPALRGWQSNELGHRNYQHPQRSRNHFGPYLDNFSAWVIYTCLRALAVQPSLWAQLHGGDECLLLRQADYQDPLASPSFARLEHHPDQEIAHLAKCIRYFLTLNVEQVPGLDATVAFPSFMPEIASVEELERRRAEHAEQRLSAVTAEDWIHDTDEGGIATKVRTQTTLKTSTQTAIAHFPPTATSGAGGQASNAGTWAPAPGRHTIIPNSLLQATTPQGQGFLTIKVLAGICGICIGISSMIWHHHNAPSVCTSSQSVPPLLHSAPPASPISPPNLSPAVAMYRRALAEQRYADAITCADNMLKANPNAWQAYWYRAFAERQLGRFDAAIADSSKSIKFAPSVEAYFNRGAAEVLKAAHSTGARNRQALQSAIADLNRLLDSNDDAFSKARGYYYRGVAYEILGHLQKAIEDYDHVIELKPLAEVGSFETYSPGPTPADVYFRRGLAYASLRKYDRAIDDFSACLNQGYYYPAARFNRSVIYYRDGQYKLALEDINIYIQDARKQVNVDKGKLAVATKLQASIEKALRRQGTKAHSHRAQQRY